LTVSAAPENLTRRAEHNGGIGTVRRLRIIADDASTRADPHAVRQPHQRRRSHRDLQSLTGNHLVSTAAARVAVKKAAPRPKPRRL
jgi:hypothetical protein